MANHRFTIALSASVPSVKRSEKYQEFYNRIPYAQIQVDEAVISLARSSFQARGQLVFGGHPTITGLVTMVALEFPAVRDAENIKQMEYSGAQVTIFQSEAYEKVIAPQNKALFNSGHARVVWTPAAPGDVYEESKKGERQCLASLTLMRKQMLNGQLDGLVCIGGMEGVEEEFELFRTQQPRKPIFLFASTGGATQILAERYRGEEGIFIFDFKPPVTEESAQKTNFGNLEKYRINSICISISADR